MISITIDDHGTLQRLENFAARAKNPRALMLAVGKEIAEQQRQHLRACDASHPNKLSGPRTHYYNRIADSVQEPVVSGDGTQVTVFINDPTFAQKVFGGPITPKRAKALTIPVTPESYGRTAAQFEAQTGQKLILIRTTKGNAALATISANHQVSVQYILSPRVNQEPDSDALLDQRTVNNAALTRAQQVLQQQLQEP